MKCWLTISGTRVFRLYKRGLGEAGYLTLEERGRAEEPLTGLLPMWKLRWRVDDFSYYCVPATVEMLAEYGYGPGADPLPRDATVEPGGDEEQRRENGWQRE